MVDIDQLLSLNVFGSAVGNVLVMFDIYLVTDWTSNKFYPQFLYSPNALCVDPYSVACFVENFVDSYSFTSVAEFCINHNVGRFLFPGLSRCVQSVDRSVQLLMLYICRAEPGDRLPFWQIAIRPTTASIGMLRSRSQNSPSYPSSYDPQAKFNRIAV